MILTFMKWWKAGRAGYDVLIIDCVSHAWQELLEEVDWLAYQKYRGKTFAAWKDGTPKQKRFINAILQYPGHVIVTMRSKTEWGIETRTVKITLSRMVLSRNRAKV